MAYRTGLYALPIAGRFIYEYDRMKDYGYMARDYKRNTGRTYKYATQGYEAQMYRQAGLPNLGTVGVISHALLESVGSQSKRRLLPTWKKPLGSEPSSKTV